MPWLTAMLLLATLLTGCTADPGPLDPDGLRPHLAVQLLLPGEFEPDAGESLRAELRFAGVPYEEAETATFVLWPEAQPDQAVTLPAQAQGEGVYTAASLLQEGLYRVQFRAETSDGDVMPMRRLAVGPAAIEALAALETSADESATEAATGGGHHHH
ncbi:hypothetical protein IDH44_21075 [Paenibacillus sp. IB182496]|uniref:YtkA-like domain-containing protein n=1 Tax=Paenibacillus sabuli TaxID=2772509 RepID=A0A927BVN6_9BACL|nr:hypothetical protein [Paenibacillus sabuli]MBD2847692.1 hypothetical protein [Paenibacillus sabuli]